MYGIRSTSRNNREEARIEKHGDSVGKTRCGSVADNDLHMPFFSDLDSNRRFLTGSPLNVAVHIKPGCEKEEEELSGT